MPSDADRQLAEEAAGHYGVFTLADARRAGLRRHQIRERVENTWLAYYEGVFRIAGTPDTWLGRLYAATKAAEPGGAVSHRSGGAVYELPGGTRDLIELSCLRWKRARHAGLVVHESRRLDERDITTVDGIPVTTPARTILDLASCFPSERYLEYVLQAARRKRLITYESMRATFDRHARRGLKGVRALRVVLDGWDPASRPTESEMETRLLQILRDHGLPEPVTQFEIRDGAGELVARTDAALPQWRIVIEYDSKQEHSDEFQVSRDSRRRNRIIAAGYAPLVARHRDLVTGGHELYREIVETRTNWRRRVGEYPTE